MARENGRVVGGESSRGFIRAEKVGISVAGSSSLLASMVDMRLPI